MSGAADISLTVRDFDELHIDAQNGKGGPFGSVYDTGWTFNIQGEPKLLRMLAAALAEAAGKAEALAQLHPAVAS